MQASSNDVHPDADLAGLLHSPELEARLAGIAPAILATVTGSAGDLDDAWFSAFDDTQPVDDGRYEDDPVSLRPRGPLRFVVAIGAAATAVLVTLAAM